MLTVIKTPTADVTSTYLSVLNMQEALPLPRVYIEAPWSPTCVGSLLKGHGINVTSRSRQFVSPFSTLYYSPKPSVEHPFNISLDLLGLKIGYKTLLSPQNTLDNHLAPIQEMRTHVSAAMMRLEPSHDFEFCKSVGCIGPQDFLNRICSAIPLRATTKYVAAAGIFQSHHLVSSCNSTAALADRSPSLRSRLLQRAAIRSLKNPTFLTQSTLVASSPLLAVFCH